MSRPEESPANVDPVGDHFTTMRMGHLMLADREITSTYSPGYSLESSFNHEIKVGNSTLEERNDGHT